MNNYIDHPSTSSVSESLEDSHERKGNAIFEYCDANGETIIFEAPESSIFYDDDGNAVICAESLEQLTQSVVHEETVQINDGDFTDGSGPSHRTNKSILFKEGFPKSTVLMTSKSLEDKKAALFGKAGARKKSSSNENILRVDGKEIKVVNRSGSILNRNLPGMNNMFKVVADSAIMKVEKTFENENVEDDCQVASAVIDNQEKTMSSHNEDEDDDEEDSEQPPKLTRNAKKPGPSEIENDAGTYDQWPLLSKIPVDFGVACEILVGIRHVPEQKLCKSVPLEYKQEGTFVLDLRAIPEYVSTCDDGNGKWGQPSGKLRFYKDNGTGKLVRADDGKGKLKEWTKDYTFKIVLKKYEHAATKSLPASGLGHFHKKIYTAFTSNGKEKIAFTVITYAWSGGRAWNFDIPFKKNKEVELKKTSKNWEKESQDKVGFQTMPQIVSAFFEGFNIYSHNAIDFNEASAILLGGTLVDSNKKCGAVPTGFKQNGTFVIDLKRMGYNLLELRKDDNGIWTKPSGFSRFYKFDANGDAVRVDKCGKLMEGLDYDVKIFSKRYEHPQVQKKFVRKIYTAKGRNEDHYEGSPSLAVIVYYWKGKPIPFEPMFKQNSVNVEKAEFNRLQEMDADEDEFLEAPIASAVSEFGADSVPIAEPRDTSHQGSRKRLRLDIEDENQMNEARIDVLRKEHENQERFSLVLDRAESLLSRLEQRITVLEYEATNAQVWNPEESEVIEEEVIDHNMADYQ